MQCRGRVQRSAKQLSAEEDREGVRTHACTVHQRAWCSLGEAKDGLDLPWERRICAVRAAEQTGRQAPGERAACQSDFLALIFLRACSLSHGFSRRFSCVFSQPLKDCFPAWFPHAKSWERVWGGRHSFVPVPPVGRRMPNPAQPQQRAQRVLGWG